MYLYPDDKEELALLWKTEYIELIEMIKRDKAVSIGHLDWLLNIAISIHEREDKRFIQYLNSIDEEFTIDLKPYGVNEAEKEWYYACRQAVIDSITDLLESVTDMLEMIVRYYPKSKEDPRIQELLKRFFPPYHIIYRTLINRPRSTPPPVQSGKPPKADPGTLADYIKEEYQAKLLPFLTENYRNTGEQKIIVPMLFALDSIEVTHPKISSAKKAKLYKAVTATLGNVGGESGFNTSLRNYNGTYYAKDVRDEAIEPHRRKIKEVLGL